MAGVSKQVSSTNSLKIICLFFDLLILLSITGDKLNRCEHSGISSSSSSTASSTLAILLSFPLLFLIVASCWIVIKYCCLFTCKREDCSCCCFKKCCCSCTYDGPSNDNGFDCSCSCEEGERENCLKMTAYISYDVLSIIMCVFFLIGDNLSDDVCIFFGGKCKNFHLNSNTCMISVNRTCIHDNEQCYWKSIDSECSMEELVKCRLTSVTFLGISTLLNLFLLYLDHRGIIKDLSNSAENYPLLTATFNLFPLIIIFDQTISGLHDSVFKLTTNETQLCPTGTHVSGGIVFGISCIIWLFLAIIHFCEHAESIKESFWSIVGATVVVFSFYVLYIFVDSPWPWDCFDADKMMKRQGLQGRLGLLVFTFIFTIIVEIAHVIFICCTYD